MQIQSLTYIIVTSVLVQTMKAGADICVTVTLLDGLVLARSVFHHSMNYRSVVLFGHTQASLVSAATVSMLVVDMQKKGYVAMLLECGFSGVMLLASMRLCCMQIQCCVICSILTHPV